MPDKILNGLSGNSIKEFSFSLRQGVPSAVFGVPDSFKNYLIANAEFKVLFLVNDVIAAENHRDYLCAFTDKKVEIIYPKDEILTFSKAFYKGGLYKRICAVSNIKDADVIIATPESLMQTFPKRVEAFVFEKGKDYDRENYITFLVSAGYKRADAADCAGVFSLRGDVLDIFPINSAYPVRIDFFGDTVESIKTFDAETHDTVEILETVKIYQATEFIFGESDYAVFLSAAKKETGNFTGKAKDRILCVKGDVDVMIENRLSEELSSFAVLSGNCCDFTYHLSGDFAVVIDEPKKTFETMNFYYNEFKERFSSLLSSGEVFPFMKDNLLQPEIFCEKLLSKKRISAFSSIAATFGFFDPLNVIKPVVSGVFNYKLDYKELFNDIKNWRKTGYSVVICVPDGGAAEKLKGDFYEFGVSSDNVKIVISALNSGFIYHETKTALIGSENVFAKKRETKSGKLKKRGFFTAPERGDYCVHEIHGVGRVIGNKRISSTEGSKEYIAVEYYGKDILYVPVEQMDILTRYLGGEKNPKLSKLGGGEFERVKQNVKESIKKMSFDIKRLYEERNAQSGYKFIDDGDMVKIFIDAFPFEDTEDQITATEETLSDMKAGKVMDRLICGDVGFGKTEIAFRAAFLAALNGKQTALLSPTTILSEQHYRAAAARFNDFGVKVGVINRFKTPAEQKEIIKKTESGEIDLLIGTHRLLSGDIKFKDLGLLILDEEQRFGVEHKEKIKLLKKNVDTLTLTATPIPRTLHMSLSGIRAISTINTPPKKRLPVQTYVVEETDALIVDAVMREINRGGQAFILYNRVESIDNFAAKIKSLLSGAKLTVVHGQMDERTLERNVLSFYRGEYDVLISTTIIENGVDLPKANTLIVIDADRLGLSTLYQLKGRVGRSDRLAYAYFTYKRDKVLTKNAYDRLSALMQFAEMGSGIKIAMRDLEIRGAGNVLGVEQHGHMDKIGYELYSKLLKEELTGEKDVIAALDIRVSAFIPDYYIESRSAKMDAYKEIAEIRTENDEKSVRKDLINAYGDIPEQTDNLINIAVVKSLAKIFGAEEINVMKGSANLVFKNFKVFGDERLILAINESGVKTKISMSEKPTLEFKSMATNAETLKEMKKFLVFSVKS